MSNMTFAEDESSRKLIRVLLALQLAGVALVLGLRLFQLVSLALAISILTLLLLTAGLVWLYLRYRSLPVVREKSRLGHLLHKFQKRLEIEQLRVESAARERQRLVEAEQEELEDALLALQAEHIETGLASASIYEASIPGVGSQLKERLAEHGILSAALVTEGMSALPGFGPVKHQALLAWRRSVLRGLERTKPGELPEGQRERIQKKYQVLQEKNGAVESKARSSKELLQHELTALKPRFRQLAPLTFPRYVSRSLAPHGLTAGLVAFGLVAAQVVSSVSATGAMFRAAPTALIPDTGILLTEPSPTTTSTPPPTLTPLPTETLLPTATSTTAPTLTFTPLPADLPATAAACLAQTTARETALVVGVVDGDTIDVRIGANVLRVRYIGVDTPELDEPLYAEATDYNRSLVANQAVTLVRDISETDSFGRLLRYVIAGDTFVNAALVERGYAAAIAYPPDTACIVELETAQRTAQAVQAGLWLPAPAVLASPTLAASSAACDASYPGVCIPPAPPDLDCGDIPFRRFQVLAPDPHGFDRDRDGVGCES